MRVFGFQMRDKLHRCRRRRRSHHLIKIHRLFFFKFRFFIFLKPFHSSLNLIIFTSMKIKN